jgi:hypothetical protein
MSKPISRRDAYLREQYANPQVKPFTRDIDREKRRLKREAKRKRIKHFRTLVKRDIRNALEDLIE